MDDGDPLTSSLQDVKELEQFLFTFIGAATARRPAPGEDISRLVDELGLRPPPGWAGEAILWCGTEDHFAAPDSQEQSLVLMRPGDPGALGFTVGCITVRGRRYCLECGWLYCRIVIRF